jgi:site-specific DNA-methyltransferase (adenine-specific)
MMKMSKQVDVVLTSPPYNTSKKRGTWSKDQKFHYDIKDIDTMTDEEYEAFSVSLFNSYDRILKTNGVILYNISYSTDKPYQIFNVINKIMQETNFIIADTIIWKKKSALPNNMSHNRLTRICEFVFVFCRKDELKTFYMNKDVLSVRPNGVKQYTTYYNFIEAKNNDGSCDLNKATYSSELCTKLLNMYTQSNFIVYDSFMGTGTTAIACVQKGLNYIGSELSLEQCEYARKRINNINSTTYGNKSDKIYNI